MNETFRRFVDVAFCINLDKDRDRWAFVSRQFATHHLDVMRFSAIDGARLPDHIVPPSPILKYPLKKGTYASLLSHLAVVQIAKSMNTKGVLIFEDDVQLNHDFERAASTLLDHIPDDWDFVYFGGHIRVDKARINIHACST